MDISKNMDTHFLLFSVFQLIEIVGNRGGVVDTHGSSDDSF